MSQKLETNLSLSLFFIPGDMTDFCQTKILVEKPVALSVEEQTETVETTSEETNPMDWWQVI